MTLLEKTMLLVALIAGGYIVGHYRGDSQGAARVQSDWNKDKAAHADDVLNAVNKRNADNQKLLADQKRDNAVITQGKDNELKKVRADLIAAGRLRVGPAFCGRAGSAAAREAASAGRDDGAGTGGGVLPEGVDSDIKALILQAEEAAATARAGQAFARANGFAQ